jgi:hypothetical protein
MKFRNVVNVCVLLSFSLAAKAAPISLPAGVNSQGDFGFNELESFVVDLSQNDSVNLGSEEVVIADGVASDSSTAINLFEDDVKLSSSISANDTFVDFENVIYDFSFSFENTLDYTVDIDLGFEFEQASLVSAQDDLIDFASIDMFISLFDMDDIEVFSAVESFDTDSANGVSQNTSDTQNIVVSLAPNSAQSFNGSIELLFFSSDFASFSNTFSSRLFVDQVDVNRPVNAPSIGALLAIFMLTLGFRSYKVN